MTVRFVSLTALGAAFCLCVRADRFALAAPVLAVYAINVHFLGWAGIGHEVFHSTVFTSRRTNQLLFRTFSVLTLSNYGYFASTHIQHHRITMHDGDPEAPSEVPWSLLAWFRYLTFDLPGFIRRLRILFSNARGKIPPTLGNGISRENRRDLKWGARMVLIWVVSTLVLAISIESIAPVALFVVAPFTCTVLTHLLETSQHRHMKRNVWDYRLNTRTIALNRVLRFLYANMNFHIEHHLFPAIPYYNLPRLRAVLVYEGFLNSECPKGVADAASIVRQTVAACDSLQ